jgi:hypothetical protein
MRVVLFIIFAQNVVLCQSNFIFFSYGLRSEFEQNRALGQCMWEIFRVNSIIFDIMYYLRGPPKNNNGGGK